MLDRLHNAVALAQRRSTRVGVLFVDLDHFKQINDTLGHGAGDQVLQLVTQRLQAAVRDSDTVSRHSGDEFLVLLTDITSVPTPPPSRARCSPRSPRRRRSGRMRCTSRPASASPSIRRTATIRRP